MKPAPSHPAVLTPWRFCASCGLTLTCWCVWLALGASLCGLLYVAISGEFPVPGFVLRRIEARLEADGLALHFGRVRFDPTGKILLEDVRLGSRQFEEPLLTARQILVDNTLWAWSVGDNVPREIRIEGAMLQLPAILAPGGVTEPLVRDLAVSLHRDPGVWHIEQLAGRVGPVPLTLHGTLAFPRKPGAAPPDFGAIVSGFLRTGRAVALQFSRLTAAERPLIAAQIAADANGSHTLTLLVTADAVHQQADVLPWPVVLTKVAATASFPIGAATAPPVRIDVAAQSGQWSGVAFAENLRAVLTVEPPPAGSLVPRPLAAQITASRLTTMDETAVAPLVRLRLDRYPQLTLQSALQIGGEALALAVETNLRDGSATVDFAGSAQPAFVNGLLAKHTPRFAPYLVLGDPVGAQARARFADGWKFTGLTARVRGGRIDSRGVAITGLEGTIDFDGREFLAHDAMLQAGANVARGSYWMDVRSRDYRMLLTGCLRPPDIGGWFHGEWWSNLWDNFAFPVAPPEADVDIAGRWTEPRLSENFIGADARQARIRDTEFDRVRTVIFTRPHFTHGLKVDATRHEGAQTLAGTFIRRADPFEHQSWEVEFDLTSSLDREAMEKLTHGSATPILDDWRFTRPPQLKYAGRWRQQPEGGRFDLSFTGHADGGLRYHGFPLDSVDANGRLAGRDLRLDRISFVAAGGRGEGKAALDGPPEARRLGFDFNLKDAQLAQAVHAMQEFNAARSGVPPPATPDNDFLKRAGTGRLDVALSADGAPGEIASFRGNGNAQLTNADLAEVHLFGLLSQLLSGLSLNFSTMKFDTARANFSLGQGRLQFPDLKVTGSSGAVIDARGYYEITADNLNFTGRFIPYDSRRNILTVPLSLVLNPLTRIIELKLSGRLADPKWTYTIAPTETPETPKTPAPSAEGSAPTSNVPIPQAESGPVAAEPGG